MQLLALALYSHAVAPPRFDHTFNLPPDPLPIGTWQEQGQTRAMVMLDNGDLRVSTPGVPGTERSALLHDMAHLPDPDSPNGRHLMQHVRLTLIRTTPAYALGSVPVAALGDDIVVHQAFLDKLSCRGRDVRSSDAWALRQSQTAAGLDRLFATPIRSSLCAGRVSSLVDAITQLRRPCFRHVSAFTVMEPAARAYVPAPSHAQIRRTWRSACDGLLRDERLTPDQHRRLTAVCETPV